MRSEDDEGMKLSSLTPISKWEIVAYMETYGAHGGVCGVEMRLR